MCHNLALFLKGFVCGEAEDAHHVFTGLVGPMGTDGILYSSCLVTYTTYSIECVSVGDRRRGAVVGIRPHRY